MSMSREDACTVSRSTIELTPTGATLAYCPTGGQWQREAVA